MTDVEMGTNEVELEAVTQTEIALEDYREAADIIDSESLEIVQAWADLPVEADMELMQALVDRTNEYLESQAAA